MLPLCSVMVITGAVDPSVSLVAEASTVLPWNGWPSPSRTVTVNDVAVST